MTGHIGMREAFVAYRALGWPAGEHDGRLELVTGSVIDVLEVPRAAGTLAARWWLHSEGAADEVRGLPTLPDPRHALAVIAAGERLFFIAAAGDCPWHAEDPVTTRTSSRPDVAVIKWHSNGSRIPAPPGKGDADPAEWAHVPDRGVRLARPAVLLHLLAAAAATVRHGPQMLALPGGVLAVPALGGQPRQSSASAAGPLPRPHGAVGFRLSPGSTPQARTAP